MRANGRERDLRKLARVEGMLDRAARLLAPWETVDWRKAKRAKRLRRQAQRIMEVRMARFTAARVAGRWP